MAVAARIAVGIPTIVAGDRLDRCLASVLAQEGVAADVVLIENGPASASACSTWELHGIEVHRPARNLGVAASWNYACRWAWNRGHDACVLLNDDVSLTQVGSLAYIRSAVDAQPRRLYFLNGDRFAAFCVTAGGWGEAGEFDEGFWPAYYEDIDWQRRVLLRDVPWSELGLAAEHVGSGTRLADPALQCLVELTYPLNEQRYVAKWGGAPEAEEYSVAWNGGEPSPPVEELLGEAPPRRTLDLGCGTVPRGEPGYERWGVDIVASPSAAVRTADLAFEPIPFPDANFERVYAYDFLEHVPMRTYVQRADASVQTVNAVVELFNEVWRVLVPGGVFESFTPHLPNWLEAFRDPTHVSFWTEQTWEYLVANGAFVPLGRHYGLRADFELVTKEWRGAHLYVELRKPSPA